MRLARLAITSLTFMLVCVPDPVCQTTQRKMIVEFAVGDFLRGRGNRRGAPAIEDPKRVIDLGRGALDQAQRAHDLDRHPLGADPEILQ